MSKIRAVVVDPDAPNRLALADVEEPSPTTSEALVRVAAGARVVGLVRREEQAGLVEEVGAHEVVVDESGAAARERGYTGKAVLRVGPN
jgi:NADPH:quinone reductase-like Zn-dependent oxidoreductase